MAYINILVANPTFDPVTIKVAVVLMTAEKTEAGQYRRSPVLVERQAQYVAFRNDPKV